MMKLHRYSALYLTLFFFVLTTSCVVEEADLSHYTGSPIKNVEEARDIELTYTDSANLVLKLKAPLSRRAIEKYSVEEEFPEGIQVTFYDKSGKERSWLSADYAVRNQVERTITVQRNVVLKNDEGEMMEGPELVWDEKSKEIRTDRFVKITRPDGVIYSHGFKSNEDFTHYELNAGSGDMTLPEEEE